ncbi:MULTISPECIES: SOS response-associated peptidase [unclassified Rhizobium]|uniref:SOS response-associated peptidase n=1 Tax=unclassified Rhizobium TaxID=2613769 RepID=UPI001AD97D8C|nr:MULTISPECIES: SOS response-associated peptidase [unclassified Rhizobium]MBO9102175.1 SOS response-associated peptidase [Rhizobium sp. L58/93]MBO9171894.1 SOS response-associated peptidase [Rhizobium sp. L245/93]MBO9186448.1 SOS response-associated peptidase [Rhizobium sp. E27B/91]QXZ87198.1 SOS response-associated peptidase [Rhizobium sp. K1/93]QXZ92769.1 SOS response-associated peptidase [Rhizobium sp. K15/93]
MCNLYNLTSNQQAIRDFIDVTRYREGNLPPSINVHPDRPGPIIRVDADGERELVMSVWGMPTPDVHLGGKPDKGVTNVRKTWIPHWQQWLGVKNRCLVPATAFSEYEQLADPETGRKPLRWFALNEGQPVFALAGIHTRWTGARGPIKAPREGEHDIYAFLTTDPNDLVKPIHPKAMPVLLTTREECEIWMTADWKEARKLQRPLPEEKMTVLPRYTAVGGLGGRPGQAADLLSALL